MSNSQNVTVQCNNVDVDVEKAMQRAVVSFQVVLSMTTRVDNTLGESINLLKCVCHASLSFIDPFNNPIIKLMC